MEGVAVNAEFWTGRRVLVTGHTGFKGGWLSLLLKSLGAEVYGFALPPETTPSLFDVARVAEGMRSTFGDIRHSAALAECFAEARPEVVIHMAAQALVRYSYREPILTFDTNVMGTVRVLDAVRLGRGTRAVVNVTTDKCYENREWPWAYREIDRLGGHDPYSSSKACSEIVTAAYRSSFFAPADHAVHGVALASARAGNVVGGGDWAEDRLIPDAVRAIANGSAVSIRNPHAIRPWQHVLGPLSGYLLLAERLYSDGPVSAEPWNFGPVESGAATVAEIIDRFTALWGGGARWTAEGGEHPHETTYLRLDSSKARQMLGWKPRWTVDVGLKRTVEWYTAHREGRDMRDFTMGQIREYRDATSNDCTTCVK